MRNVLHQHYLWKHLQLWLLNNGQRQCFHAWIMVCTLTNRHSNHVNANTIQMKQLDPISFLYTYMYIKYKIIFRANQFFWKLNIRRITPAESFKHLFWKMRISEVSNYGENHCFSASKIRSSNLEFIKWLIKYDQCHSVYIESNRFDG